MQHDATLRAEPMEANPVTDITLARDLARIRIAAPIDACDPARLVELLEAQGVRVRGVDLASAPGARPRAEITLVLRHADLARARLLVYEYFDAAGEYDVQCESELTTISILGFGVSFDLAMIARIMGALGQHRAGVRELATSEDRIDCFVDPERAERAVMALHAALGREERVA
jgi:aspartokinase